MNPYRQDPSFFQLTKLIPLNQRSFRQSNSVFKAIIDFYSDPDGDFMPSGRWIVRTILTIVLTMCALLSLVTLILK